MMKTLYSSRKSLIFCVLGLLICGCVISDVTLGDPTRAPKHHSLAWSRDGKFLAIGGEEGILFYDSNFYKIGHLPAKVGAIAWSPTQNILVTSQGDLIEVPSLITLKTNIGLSNGLSWSPDGSFIASAFSRSIKIWSIHENDVSVSSTLNGDNTYWEDSLEWSPNQSFIAAVNTSGLIEIWDIKSSQLLLTLDLQTSDPLERFVSWSPDGSKVVSFGLSNEVYIWDAVTGQVIYSFQAGNPDQGLLSDIVWDPTGMYIATANRKSLKLWNSTNGELIDQFDVEGTLYKLSYNPEGTRLTAIGTVQGEATIWMWDVQNHNLIDIES